MSRGSKIVLLLASSLTVMSVSAISPALPRIAQAFSALPNAEFLVKLMLTIPSLIIALMAPVAGQIIDRGHRRSLLIGSLILYALAGTTGLYLVELQHFIFARAVLGIAVAGIMTSAQTLIADYYTGVERNKALGLQGSFISFGGVIFVAAAGLLATESWRYPFGLYSLALILAGPAFWLIREPEHKYAHQELAHISDTTTDSSAPEKLTIAGICLLVFCGMTLFYSIPTQLPFYLKQYFAIDSPARAGAIVSLATLAGGISSYLMPTLRSKMSFPALGALSFSLMAAGFTGLQFSPGYMALLFSALSAGSGIGLLMPSMRLWVISTAQLQRRGKSVGFLTGSLYLGQFLSPILAQPFLQYIGLHLLYAMAAGCAGAAALFLWLRTARKI
jgi:MFS family permease